MNKVVRWQRAEGVIIFLCGFAIFGYLDSGIPWWLAVLVFFAPDFSFAAYLFGSKVGAFGYNFVHVYAFGVVFLAMGIVLDAITLSTLGALWLAHSGFDRMLGYGLKSIEGFNFTHLGKIGKEAED